MNDRQLIADLLSALEYHTEQTRPIEFSKVAIQAAREYLRKPAQPMHPEIKKMYEDYFDKCFRESSPTQQEPVAWLITDEKINSLQVDSIQRLIDRARHAHMTDIKLRINGQDEWFQADWLKHLTRTTPPQRTWVGLTDEEQKQVALSCGAMSADWLEFAKAIEAKLKDKNGF